jgi:hypothetical protein
MPKNSDCDILARLIKAIGNENPTFLKTVLSQVVGRAVQENDVEVLRALSDALNANGIYRPMDGESSLLPLIGRDGRTIVFTSLHEVLKDQTKFLQNTLAMPKGSGLALPNDNGSPLKMTNKKKIIKILIKTFFHQWDRPMNCKYLR